MRPPPNLNDEQAMLKRGRRSALGAARKEATEALRDALVAIQSAGWDTLRDEAAAAHGAADRLMTLAAMWSEVE